MLFTDASYMPERNTRCVGMNKMGLNHDNSIILLKKCILIKIAFLGKKSDFGNRTRVEGKDDYETRAGASLFWISGLANHPKAWRISIS